MAGHRDNILEFGSGISASDVRFERVSADWNDMKISFGTFSGSILLDNQQWWDAGIEKIMFADGTQWSDAEIRAHYTADQATVSDDTIWATGDSDMLAGGLGNDRLEGAEGSDTYVYNAGDGNDTILDYRGSRDNVLSFGAGILADDVVFSRVAEDSNDYRISFHSVAGSIILDNQEWWDAGIETIRFADGTVWNEADIATHYVTDQATSGDDAVFGTVRDDVVNGGQGNDTLRGFGGNDTFVFRDNFGNDTISDFAAGAGSQDVIDFKTDQFADFAAVMAAASQAGSDTLISLDAYHSVLLKNVGVNSLHQDDFRFTAAA